MTGLYKLHARGTPIPKGWIFICHHWNPRWTLDLIKRVK